MEVDRIQNAWHSRNTQSGRCAEIVVTLLIREIRNLAFGVFHFSSFLLQICPPETKILKICRVLYTKMAPRRQNTIKYDKLLPRFFASFLVKYAKSEFFGKDLRISREIRTRVAGMSVGVALC